MATRSLHPASGLIPPPSSGGHRTSADAPGPAKTTLLLSDKVRILVFCLPSRGSLSAYGLLPAPGPLPVCGSFPSRGSLSTCGPLPSRGSLSAHGLLPAPGPFPVCGSFPSRGSLSTCGPLPSRGSLSAHGPFPAPGPLPVCGSFPSRSSLPTPTHLPASDSRPFRGLSPRTSPLFLGPEPFLPPSGAESRPPGARSVGKAGPQLSSPCREERTGRCANLSPPFARRKSASSFRRRAKPCRCCSRVRRSAHLPAGTIACRPAPAFVVPPHPMPAGGAVSVRPRSRRRGGERAVLRRTKVASRTGPPFSAAFSGAVSPRFFLLPPDGSGRHMTYRNRAIVPPRCGLQRAGSVPPRSAERRAVRRPVPVVQPPTAPRPFMGSAPLAERIPPHRAAGCSDEETFGDHRLFPAASPLFCRFALTKGRPLLTNGFGALIFAGSPFPVRRPLPEIKSTWGGRRRQHHGRFGRSN